MGRPHSRTSHSVTPISRHWAGHSSVLPTEAGLCEDGHQLPVTEGPLRRPALCKDRHASQRPGILPPNTALPAVTVPQANALVPSQQPALCTGRTAWRAELIVTQHLETREDQACLFLMTANAHSGLTERTLMPPPTPVPCHRPLGDWRV